MPPLIIFSPHFPLCSPRADKYCGMIHLKTHTHTHPYLSTWSRSAKSASVSVMRQSCVNATPEAIMTWSSASWSPHQSNHNGKLIMACIISHAGMSRPVWIQMDFFYMFTLRQVIVCTYRKCWCMYWYLMSCTDSRFFFFALPLMCLISSAVPTRWELKQLETIMTDFWLNRLFS